MPSGPKKRRAARNRQKNKTSHGLKPLTDFEPAEDSLAGVNVRVTPENLNDESAKGSKVDESSKESENGTAKITVDSDTNIWTYKNVISIAASGNADQDQDYENKENEEASEPEPSLSVKDPSSNTDIGSAEDASAHVKVTQANPDESVTGSYDESPMKSINDTGKMDENIVDSAPNVSNVNALSSDGGEKEPACSNPTIVEPSNDEFKISVDNVLSPFGAVKPSESATSTLSDSNGKNEIHVSPEANFSEIILGSIFVKIKHEHNLEFKGPSNTEGDDLAFLDVNNSMSVTPSTDQTGMGDSSDAITLVDGSGFITKQDDGVDTAYKENEFDIQKQNDKGTFNSQGDGSTSCSQEMADVDEPKEELLSTESVISNIPKFPSPLTNDVEIIRLTKMVEEALFASDKQTVTLKEVLNHLDKQTVTLKELLNSLKAFKIKNSSLNQLYVIS